MISLIIPTKNRAALLNSALLSIVNQTIDNDLFEIIVVDNGSTDNTSFVVSNLSEKFRNIQYIFKQIPGLHVGRHVGMLAAKGEILVFADDDIEALPSWLISIKETFHNSKVAMVGGNNYPLFLEPPPKWLKKMWNRPTLRGCKSISSLSIIEFTIPPREISPYLVWGCNFAIRKDVLLQAGGFHPDGMPKELIRFRGDGETHVSRYVAETGMKCLFHPGASVYHKVTPDRMTFTYFRQRGFNQGVSDSYTKLRKQDETVQSSKHNLVKRVMSYAFRQSLSYFDSAEVKKAFDELKLGYGEGYAFHQAAYRDDPELREWVHLTTYI
jgi:glucosyl-dolichyl phosphate glucuronosyltransferase